MGDKAYYEANTQFEGSNDGKTYTKLFIVDDKVHEGWNYYKWEKAAD